MSTVTVAPPTNKDVTDLVHGLLGVDVKEAAASDDAIYSIASFKKEDGEIVGYLACDLGTGCRLGAGLTCIPPNAAEDAVKSGEIPENLSQNMDEIFNICVNLLHVADSQRIVLDEVVHGSGAESFATHQQAIEGGETHTFGFEVARYGLCKMIVGC